MFPETISKARGESSHLCSWQHPALLPYGKLFVPLLFIPLQWALRGNRTSRSSLRIGAGGQLAGCQRRAWQTTVTGQAAWWMQ